VESSRFTSSRNDGASALANGNGLLSFHLDTPRFAALTNYNGVIDVQINDSERLK
jgi:hypothetical protein